MIFKATGADELTYTKGRQKGEGVCALFQELQIQQLTGNGHKSENGIFILESVVDQGEWKPERRRKLFM